MASRFTFLETMFTILVAVGGVTTLVANWLELEQLKNGGIMVMILGVIVFGITMVFRRRAEIGTRYSSSINPSFHVFRGVGAISWGIVFIVAGLLWGGYAYIWLTNWTEARNFFGEHNGIVIALIGILLTALGAGSATRATYRYKQSERPDRRFADRLAAIIFVIPLGVAILSWGLIKTFAPSVAQAVKGATQQWLESIIKGIAN